MLKTAKNIKHRNNECRMMPPGMNWDERTRSKNSPQRHKAHKANPLAIYLCVLCAFVVIASFSRPKLSDVSQHKARG
jgi:hypothetical protein